MICWLHMHGSGDLGPCDGRWDRAHLIPRQLMRREGLEHLIPDRRTWVPACRRHHGMLDFSRTLRIARAELPVAVETFAEEHDLGWFLDREYGPLSESEAA